MPATSRNASSIEIGSTSGVKRRRMAITWRLTVRVLAAVDGQEDALRAERAGRSQRHRRADAEGARLVGRRADHAAIGRAATADDDRPAAQLRAIALLDGGEEGVEIDVQDGRAWTSASASSRGSARASRRGSMLGLREGAATVGPRAAQTASSGTAKSAGSRSTK